jgi:hypothetical protein
MTTLGSGVIPKVALNPDSEKMDDVTGRDDRSEFMQDDG